MTTARRDAPRHFDLVEKVMEEKRRACLIVNNRSEGNAPLTIQALMKELASDTDSF
jgi:hypothetical protein